MAEAKPTRYRPPKKPRIEDVFADDLRKLTGAPWVREFVPCETRGWRIDVALPSIKLAVEIEGRQHARARQHVSDCEKRNYLEARSWTVLTYPASRVTGIAVRRQVLEQIHRVMCAVVDNDLDADVLKAR